MSIRTARPLFVVSIILLLAFFALGGWPSALRLLPADTRHVVFQLLYPGSDQTSSRWLFGRLLQMGLGTAGLALFCRAISGQLPWSILARSRELVAQYWRQIVWAILLGQFAAELVDDFFRIWAPSLEHRSPLLQWYGRILPIAGVVVCARLLFARRPWRGDGWAGYIAAAVALFSLGWSILQTSNIARGIFELLNPNATGLTLANVANIAYLAATAWSGLFLARRSTTAASTWSPAAIGYLTAATLVFSAACSLVGSASYIPLLAGATLSAFYFAPAAVFACWSLLCVLHALSLAAPGSESAPATGMVASFRAGLQSVAISVIGRRFWGDIGISLVVSALLLLLGFAAMSGVPVEISPFLFPLMVFAVFAGPIVVFVFGVIRGRPGMAAGSILLLAGILGYRFVNLQIAAQRADEAVAQTAELNLLPFGAPARAHDIVLIQDSYFGRSDGAQQGCAEICTQILLNSSHAVAIADQGTQDWRVYRKVVGQEVCSDPAHIATYLQLLASGIAGTCIEMTRQKSGPDALVIDEDLSHDSAVWKTVPPQVHGAAYEFFERQDGVDKLLGRVISGGVQPALLSGQDVKKTPIQMRPFEFYAAALQLPIQERVPYRAQDLPAVLATLEGMFRDPAIGKKARGAYWTLSQGIKDASAAEVFKASILHFWQTEDPELIKLGLATLYRIRGYDVAFAKPFVTRYMASDDTAIMKAAVGALNAYDTNAIGAWPLKVQPDMEFAKPSIGNVILSERVAAYGSDYGNLVEVMKRMPGSFPEDMRSAALEQLKTRQGLAPDRLLVLLGIVARGDAEKRQATVDWIFSLRGQPFEAAIHAVRRDADVLATGYSASFWSDSEMEELVRRTADVPDERLESYIRSIQFQMAFKDNQGTVQDLLTQRIERLGGGSERERKLAASLEVLSKSLRR